MFTDDLSPAIVQVDLGKTSSRALITDGSGRRHVAKLGGVASSNDIGRKSATTIIETIGLLPEELIKLASACGIGAAGLLTDSTAARYIAHAVHSEFGFAVAAASDIITAHAGAFGGSSGTTLVAGTGAVAVRISATGELRRVDGWGPEIGDLGGGSWIGREGFRSVLAAECGRGEPTGIAAKLTALTEGQDPVRWVAQAGNAAQQLARLAPAVLDEANDGDAVARSIVRAALTHLGATAAAAATIDDPQVAVLGGLTEHPWFAAQLNEELSQRQLIPAPLKGDALTGALLIATTTDLPHERHINRAN